MDAILITCTNYIALLKEDQLSIAVPIIKIDEPFFDFICKVEQPQIILFSNPATVKGTMERLRQYADCHQKPLDIEAKIIHDTFGLIMQGLKKEYNQKISEFLNQMMKDDNKTISVAQLSMVEAFQQVEDKTFKQIITPLDTLVSFMANHLKLEKNDNMLS